MDAKKDNATMKLENQLCFPLYAAARSVTGLYTPWLKQLVTEYFLLKFRERMRCDAPHNDHAQPG